MAIFTGHSLGLANSDCQGRSRDSRRKKREKTMLARLLVLRLLRDIFAHHRSSWIRGADGSMTQFVIVNEVVEPRRVGSCFVASSKRPKRGSRNGQDNSTCAETFYL